MGAKRFYQHISLKDALSPKYRFHWKQAVEHQLSVFLISAISHTSLDLLMVVLSAAVSA